MSRLTSFFSNAFVFSQSTQRDSEDGGQRRKKGSFSKLFSSFTNPNVASESSLPFENYTNEEKFWSTPLGCIVQQEMKREPCSTGSVSYIPRDSEETKASTTEESQPLYDSKVEEAVFVFCEQHLSSSTRDCLQSGKDALMKCQCSTSLFPLSFLRTSAAKPSVMSDEARFCADAVEPENHVRLLHHLAENRWGKICNACLRSGIVDLSSKELSNETIYRERNRLADCVLYIVNVLPGWFTLIEAKEISQWLNEVFFVYILETCIIPSLVLLKQFGMLLERCYTLSTSTGGEGNHSADASLSYSYSKKQYALDRLTASVALQRLMHCVDLIFRLDDSSGNASLSMVEGEGRTTSLERSSGQSSTPRNTASLSSAAFFIQQIARRKQPQRVSGTSSSSFPLVKKASSMEEVVFHMVEALLSVFSVFSAYERFALNHNACDSMRNAIDSDGEVAALDEDEVRGWELAVWTLQCSAFVVAAPIVQFCLSFILHISQFSSSFALLVELVLQIVMSLLNQLTRCSGDTSEHHEMRGLLLRQLTLAVEIIASILQSADFSVSSSTLLLLVNRNFDSLLAEALGVLGGKHFFFPSFGDSNRWNTLNRDCEKAVEDFLASPSISSIASADPSGNSTVWTVCPTSGELKEVISLTEHKSVYCSCNEKDVVENFFNVLFHLRVAQRSAKIRFLREERKKCSPSVFPPCSLQGEAFPFTVMDTMVLAMFRSCSSASLDTSVGVSCLVSFLFRYLFDLLSCIENIYLGETESSKAVAEELSILVESGLLGLLWTNRLIIHAMRGSKVILYDVLYIFSTLAKCSSATPCAETSRISVSSPPDWKLSVVTYLLTFLTEVGGLDHIASVEEGMHYQSELSLLLFAAACAILSDSFRPSRSFFASQRARNLLTEKAIDKLLLQSCLTLAKRSSHHSTPSSSLCWLMYLSESVVIGSSLYTWRSLDVFPDVVLHLFGEKFTQNFGAQLLLHLLRLIDGQPNEKEEHHTRWPMGILYNFVDCLEKTLHETSVAMMDRGDLQPTRKVLTLVRTITNAVMPNRDETSPEAFLSSGAMVRFSVLRSALCSPTLPMWFLSLVECLKATPVDNSLSFSLASTAIRCLFYLVKGSPSCRSHLLGMLHLQELFDLCVERWQGYRSLGYSSFSAIVHSFLHLAYENDGDPILFFEEKVQSVIIHNPTVLIPVLVGFTHPSHFFNEQEVLGYTLDKLLETTSSFVPDCFLVSEAGIFHPLCQLLLLCLSEGIEARKKQDERAERKASLKLMSIRIKVIRLMAQIAAHHIDVRHLKQLLSSLLINTDTTTRALILPDVTDILRTSLKLWEEETLFPSTFISLRQGSGRVGIRAVVETFPADGYSVSLWFWAQGSSGKNGVGQTLFSILDSKDAKAVIKCFMNEESVICTTFFNKQKHSMDISLDLTVPLRTWSHLVVTHHRRRLLPTSGEFQVQLNGKKMVSHFVSYPTVEKNGGPYWFYVGVSGYHSEKQCSPLHYSQQLSEQAQFEGQITKVYFFPKPLAAQEMITLFGTTQSNKNPLPYLKDSHPKTISRDIPSPVEYSLGGTEKLQHPLDAILVEKASIFIDPRVSDAHHLYNAVDLLKCGSLPLEKKLETYEGTLVISGMSDILESLCLTGAVTGILLPLMALLLDPALPFPPRFSILQKVPVCSTFLSSPKRLLSAVANLIDISLTFSSLEFIQGSLVSGGVFIVLSYILEKLAPLLPVHTPTQLMTLCDAFVVTNPSLYIRVYSSLFLCSETIHALPPSVQLYWWRCQVIAASEDKHAKKALMRSAGIQQFVVQELIFNMQHPPHQAEIKKEMFLLLDTVTSVPVTQSDATAILHLTVCSFEVFQQNADLENYCAETLYHIRCIFYSRGEELARFLWQCGFLAALYSVVTSTTCSSLSIRREATLMICLLVRHSKGAQRLMNPTLEQVGGVDVVHTFRNVDLGWLGDVLAPFRFTAETHMVLRAAMTGYQMETKQEFHCSPLDGPLHLKDFFPHVLSFTSHLLQFCSDMELLVLIASDMEKLLCGNRGFPKVMISFSGWYSALTEMYRSSIIGEMGMASSAMRDHRCHTVSSPPPSSLFTAAKVEDAFVWMDSEVLYPNHKPSLRILQSYASALGTCLLHAVLNESYGVAEYREGCGYMAVRGVHVLLSEVLKNVYVGLARLLLEDRTGDQSRLGLAERSEKDISSMIYVAEDYMFYSRRLALQEEKENGRMEGTPVEEGGEEYVEKQNLYYMPWIEENEEKIHQPGWLHLPLAIEVLKFLTIYKPALGGEYQGGVGEWISGYLPKEEERKGKLYRVFSRLLKVSASFVLTHHTFLESLIQVGHQYCDMIQFQTQSSMWNFMGTKKIHLSQNWSDIKCYSLIGTTMSAFYVYHDLLNRRLEALREDRSGHHHDTNVQLIQLLKRLFCLFRYPFSQLSIFTSYAPLKEEEVSATTPDWLSDFTLTSSLSCDTKEFEVVGSREDYSEFVSACLAVLQMSSREKEEEIALKAHQALRLQESEVLEQSLKASQHKALIQSRLESYTKKHREFTWWPSAELIGGPERSFASMQGSGFSKASFAMRTSVWSFFQARIKGTMWSPASPNSSVLYARLSMAQQRSFSRRKIMLDSSGTDHRDRVKPRHANGRDPPLNASLQRLASSSKRERYPTSSSEMADSDHMGSQDEEEKDIDLEILAMNSKSMLPSTAGTNVVEGEDGEWPAVYHSRYPSFPCEVVYLMQCWSATLVIQPTALSVIVDEENTAKNPPTAKGAESCIPRPESGSFLLSTLSYIAPGRRYRMKRNALQLLFRYQQNILLNFSSESTHHMAATVLIQATQKSATSSSATNRKTFLDVKSPYVFATRTSKEPLFQQKLNEWKCGTLNNFDYLMWLNFFAGRSLNDLSQYPIFPWVLKNYDGEEPPDLAKESSFRDLSKPIGACGAQEREEAARQRYEEQHDTAFPPAHYMSHYSSSSVVTFFMIRLEPFTSLHLVLQGGVLDSPDRLFHSVPSAFHSVSTNVQNVRELIPEMYYLPELCINANHVPFGLTSTGEQMNTLVLPPWAHGSPYEFIYRMREALESPFVSHHLHHWIDLIFGCKQTGKLAVKSLNVFPGYSYEEMVRDAADEPGMTDYFDNMGQTPIQLFKKSHPTREAVLARTLTSSTRIVLQWIRLTSFPFIACVVPWSTEKVAVVSSEGMSLTLNASTITSHSERWPSLRSVATAWTPDKGAQRTWDIQEKQKGCKAEDTTLLLLPSVCFPPQSPEKMALPGRNMNENESCSSHSVAVLVFLDFDAIFLAQGGLFDHTVVVRRIKSPGWRGVPYLFRPVYLRAHHGRVTHMAVSEDSAFLVTGGLDTTFVVWSCVLSSSHGLEIHFQYNVSTHEEYPSAVAVSNAMDLVVTASRDGVLLFHSLSGGYMERRLEHPSKYSIDHVMIQNDCYLPNILFASDADVTIHQISLNGAFIRSISLPGTRLNTWCGGPHQYFAISYSASISDCRSTVEGQEKEASVEVVALLDSFFLTTLTKVELPAGTVVTALAMEGLCDDADIIYLAAKREFFAELGVLKLQ